MRLQSTDKKYNGKINCSCSISLISRNRMKNLELPSKSKVTFHLYHSFSEYFLLFFSSHTWNRMWQQQQPQTNQANGNEQILLNCFIFRLFVVVAITLCYVNMFI